MAHAVRNFAHEHPGRYAATQTAVISSNASGERLAHARAQTVTVIAAVLREVTLPENRMVDSIRILRSAVHGFVLLELQGGFGLPDDLERSFTLLIEPVTAGVSRLGTDGR